MCDHDDRNDRPRREHDDCCCDDHYGDAHHHHHDHEEGDYEEVDPADWLRDLIEDVTEDAFAELVEERVKKRLEVVWGDKLDAAVDLVVDHFIKARQREMDDVLESAELDDQLREILKAK